MTHILKEAITAYLSQLDVNSSEVTNFFDTLLLQLETDDLANLDITEVERNLDQRETALQKTAAEIILQQCEVLSDAGFQDLNSEELAYVQALQQDHQVTIDEVASLLRDRIGRDQADYKTHSANLIRALREPNTQVDRQELVGTLLLNKQATEALQALETILEQTGVLETIGIKVPLRLNLKPTDTDHQPSEITSTEGLFSFWRAAKEYGVSYYVLDELARKGVLHEGTHFQWGLSQKNKPSRYLTVAGVEWLRTKGYIEGGATVEELTQGSPDEPEVAELFTTGSNRKRGLALLFQRQPNGGFVYKQVRDIVEALLPEGATEADFTRAYGNFTNAKDMFKNRLRDFAGDPNTSLVSEVVATYLNRADRKPGDWDEVMEYVAQEYGNLTINEAIFSVINRFESALPADWVWLSDILTENGQEYQRIAEFCFQYLHLGSEFRQVTKGLQLSSRGMKILSKFYEKKPLHIHRELIEVWRNDIISQETWEVRMTDQISWNGNFVLHRFLHSQVKENGSPAQTVLAKIEEQILPILGYEKLMAFAIDMEIVEEQYQADDSLSRWMQARLFEDELQQKPRHSKPFTNTMMKEAVKEIQTNLNELNPLDARGYHSRFDDWLQLLVTDNPELNMPAYKLVIALCGELAAMLDRHQTQTDIKSQIKTFLNKLDEWFTSYINETRQLKYDRGDYEGDSRQGL